MKVVRSEIEIGAPVQKGWDVVVDLERYPEWKTFTPRISADSPQPSGPHGLQS
jgi:uncharacterized membrane protein